MSSGDKILSAIREDSDRKIAEIQAESSAKCEKILNKAQTKIQAVQQAAEQKKAEQTDKLTKTGKSRIELEKRNAVLKTKRAEIDKTILAVLDYIKKVDDKAYFALLYRLASLTAGKEGVVYLNTKDLQRVPADFEQQLAKVGLKATLSKTPDNRIDTGFVLKNGDIEDNMDFAAVLADKREAVEDLINRELFKD